MVVKKEIFMNKIMPVKAEKRVLLVDCHNIFRRNFEAIKNKGDKDSLERAIEASNSTYNAIIKDIRFIKPTHALVAFEGENGWREKYYPEYKLDKETGKRRIMTDAMKKSILEVRSRLTRDKIFCISKEGLEADDIIGAFSKKLTSVNIAHTIDSNDKDYFQSINQLCNCYNRKDRVIIDEKAVFEKFGLMPRQITDYLCLVGDNADNIKGVAGIGHKRACEFLSKYRDIEGIIENAPIIGGKVGETLMLDETAQHIDFIKKMIDINIDINFGIKLSDLLLDSNIFKAITHDYDQYGR